jgi:hypothetical protein
VITPKTRLQKASEEAVQAYAELLAARVEDRDVATVSELQQVFNAKQHQFQDLWQLRGFVAGDRVRVTTEGPYKGLEGVIRERDRYNGSVNVRWPAGSPLADGSGTLRSLDHVMLVAPAEENPQFVRVREADGRQLACMVSDACSYKTSVWHMDDGSAEEQIHRHLAIQHSEATAA